MLLLLLPPLQRAARLLLSPVNLGTIKMDAWIRSNTEWCVHAEWSSPTYFVPLPATPPGLSRLTARAGPTRFEAEAVKFVPAEDDRVDIARGSSAKRIVEVVVEAALERFCC